MDRVPCVPIEALEALLALPAGDAKRRHVESCPRCRARLLALAEFVSAPADVPEALLAEADAHLAKVMRRELALDPVAAPIAPAAPIASVASGATSAPGAPAVRERIAPRWRMPWAWVGAGVAFATVAFLSVRAIEDRLTDAPPVLRGAPERTLAAPEGLRAEAGTGDVTLTWSPSAGAEDYQVTVYAADLTEIVRLPPSADTTVVVTRADLPPSTAGKTGASAFWRVTARAKGDPLGVSTPGTLRLP